MVCNTPNKPLPYIGAIVYFTQTTGIQRPFLILDIMDAMVNGLVFDVNGGAYLLTNITQGTGPNTWQAII